MSEVTPLSEVAPDDGMYIMYIYVRYIHTPSNGATSDDFFDFFQISSCKDKTAHANHQQLSNVHFYIYKSQKLPIIGNRLTFKLP